MSAHLLDDDYLDVCARSGYPSGIAQNVAGLKSLPVEVRSMVVKDGIDLIGDLGYIEAVAEAIRQWTALA